MLVEVINGLLGAGKTTFLMNRLDENSAKEKTAVLVNEFGQIGLDGLILSGASPNVVELPNGCICCTLNVDLRNQIKTIAETYQPDRLFIEPTGVATIRNLLGVLRSLSLEKYIDDILITVVVDASMLEELIDLNIGFVDAQIRAAHTIVVNKCDKVQAEKRAKLFQVLLKMNPGAEVIFTTHGKPLTEQFHNSKVSKALASEEQQQEPTPEEPLKHYKQYSKVIEKSFQLPELRELFQGLLRGEYGAVDRAKGLFKTQEGQWLRIDLASREISEAVLPGDFSAGRIIVIGTALDKEGLERAINSCLV